MKQRHKVQAPEQVRRSREGAWIETIKSTAIRVMSLVAPARERGLKPDAQWCINVQCVVAPARERGLKLQLHLSLHLLLRRSREGAWIET